MIQSRKTSRLRFPLNMVEFTSTIKRMSSSYVVSLVESLIMCGHNPVHGHPQKYKRKVSSCKWSTLGFIRMTFRIRSKLFLRRGYDREAPSSHRWPLSSDYISLEKHTSSPSSILLVNLPIKFCNWPYPLGCLTRLEDEGGWMLMPNRELWENNSNKELWYCDDTRRLNMNKVC